jgi:very-short-patch-repair endonuclease
MDESRRRLNKLKRRLRRYGNPMLYRKIYLEGQARRMAKNPTAPEVAFEQILKELKIDYVSQKIVGGKIYDYFISDSNILCEVDGDYYHANPEKYTELNEMQKRIAKRDKRKNIIASGLGYGLVRFWESDILSSPELIKQRLRSLF